MTEVEAVTSLSTDSLFNIKRTDAAIARIKSSVTSGQLVAVIGSGVSIALTNGKNDAVSWRGLIENGFAYGVMKSKITSKQREIWESQLSSNDLDDLLGAAE